MTEGSGVEVNVKAQGNPNAVSYLWRRGDEVVKADSHLNISSVSRGQAGLYTVEATNSQGTVAANLTINIKCEYWFWLVLENCKVVFSSCLFFLCVC